MATFIGQDEASAREALAAVGVRLLRTDSPAYAEVLGQVLDADSRDERLRMVAEPPADEPAASVGMGAWHVNNVSEFETVLSGEGIVEFWTPEGAVSILLRAGDIMAVEQAEHRYRPVTPQEWALRFGGGPEAEFVGTDTGRAADPWPDLSPR